MQLAAAAGPLQYDFFTVPLGGLLVAGTPKSYQHTNLVQAGVLEKGKLFKVEGIGVNTKDLAQGGAAPTLADVRVLNGGHLNLTFGEVSFLRIPVSQAPSGGNDIVLNDTATVNVQRGVSAVANVFWLKGAAIDLNEQEAIKCELVIPGTIAAVTDVTVTLYGTQIRPVR
jgi:hypothetical protein